MCLSICKRWSQIVKNVKGLKNQSLKIPIFQTVSPWTVSLSQKTAVNCKCPAPNPSQPTMSPSNFIYFPEDYILIYFRFKTCTK